MPRNKGVRKESPKAWAKQLFTQPPVASYQAPAIYMSGGELELRNFHAVMDYTESHLQINLGRKQLEIVGDDLRIIALEKSHLVLRGRVLRISFSEE